jgi:hypothetical protein
VTTVATFDLSPHFEYVYSNRRPALTTRAEEGVIETRQINERAHRLFRLVWRDEPSQTLARLREIHDSTYGGVGLLSYTPKDEGSAIEVMFAAPILVTRQDSASSSSFEVELEEVF